MGVSASGLPYDIGAEVLFNDSSACIWKLNAGSRKDPSSNPNVSIFTHTKTSTSLTTTTASALLHVQKLKTLRHPSIITYLDSMDTDTSLLLVTESIQPLSVWQSASTPATAVLYGIYTILLGLEFLHTKCNLSVNMSSPLAIVVDQHDMWKLNCFENTTAATATTIASDLHQFVAVLQTLSQVSSTPELLQITNKISKVAKSIPSSTATTTTTSLLQSSCFYTDAFLPYKSIATLHLTPALSSVPTLQALIPVASSLTSGLSVSLLPTIAKALGVVGTEFNNRDSRETVRQLATVALELLSALAPSLPPTALESHCAVSIIAIAAIADRSIRNNLLHALKFLTSQLTSSTTNRIFDHLLSGFSDSNPKIREATLKNLVFVVEVLDEKAIEKLLRAVGSLQSDPEAGIRTNAIIFMGKLAPKLTPQVRNRALISAFAKAFQDPFHHCRLAGTALLLLYCRMTRYVSMLLSHSLLLLLLVLFLLLLPTTIISLTYAGVRAALATVPQLDLQLVVVKLMPIGVLLLMDRSGDIREQMLQLLDLISSNVRETIPSIRAAEAAAREKKATATPPPATTSSWNMMDGLAKSLATTTIATATPPPATTIPAATGASLQQQKAPSSDIPAVNNDGWDVDFDIEDDVPDTIATPPISGTTIAASATTPAATIATPPTSTDSIPKPKSTSISSLKKTKTPKPAVTKLAVDADSWDDF